MALEYNVLPSAIKGFAMRGLPHQDLKQIIQQFATENGILAGAILSAVGSLEQVNIRYANRAEGEVNTGFYEIVSLVGTVASAGCHLHLAVSDGMGQLIGGHLLDGNLIYTTVEIVIADLTDVEFSREVDPTYHYKELVIKGKANEQ